MLCASIWGGKFSRQVPFLNLFKIETNFARDLQDRLGILALLALCSPFRICKLQIPLAARETDPVSGHHTFQSLRKILLKIGSALYPRLVFVSGLSVDDQIERRLNESGCHD
jgi:hypothetical protein